MTLGRAPAACGFALLALFVSRSAAAYEQRFTGDDVRITVDDDGVGHVEHAIGYRTSLGALKGFDVNGVEPEATIDDVAPVTIDGETVNDAHVERKSDRVLHVTLDPMSTRGVKRGAFVVRVRYLVDLAKTGEIARDGAMARLAWTSPVASEGYDAARVVIDLPAAPTEPRAIAADGSTSDDGRVVSLRRGPERDELEMARPHVARGEAATWGARIDPRALKRVPLVAPPPALAATDAPARSPFAAWGLAALAGVAFGLLARTKGQRFATACAARGAAVTALVGRGSVATRSTIAGVAFALGVAAEVVDRPTLGAIAIALAMIAAAHRASLGASTPRGPGRWLALAPQDAFAREASRDPLDASTAMGAVVLALCALGSVALGLALRRFDPAWTWLAPLDAIALTSIFFTGSRAQLPPDRVRSPARRLASLHRALRRDVALRVAPWGRVPTGAADPDELRLLVLPRAAMPGVVGIEVGVAWIPTPAGYAPETEVLVRVRDDSAAAARMIALAPKRRAVPGRKPEERVVRMVPSMPSRAGAIALVRRLAGELRDRRKSLPGVEFRGSERRLPPNERIRSVEAAA